MSSFNNRNMGRPGLLPIDDRYVVYRWLTAGQFMISAIVPDATVIEAAVEDDPEEVMSRLPRDATSFHFHLNCTITSQFPRARVELEKKLRDRGVRLINSGLTDISKRAIQRKCRALGMNTTAASPNGNPDEPIIVKTNLNFGGDSEWALQSDERAALGVGEASGIMWRPDDYRVVLRRDVEREWWTDQSLVCERYIDNRKNVWYRAVIFYSRIFLRELVNESQIKKIDKSEITGSWSIDVNELGDLSGAATFPCKVVKDLARFISEFGIEFGAVDILIDDDGEPYIIDVNSTPAYHWDNIPLIDFLRDALLTPS
jgi:hypothetical protein